MKNKIKYILSIAGFDPSGGAGVLADIKVFEQHELIGFGAITCITYQNENSFKGLKWLTLEDIVKQIEPLSNYRIEVIKIGLIENLQVLSRLILKLKSLFPNVKIIWDPIVKATTGFNFHANFDSELVAEILKNIYLVTPNLNEIEKFGSKDAIGNARIMSQHCYVALKGGHHADHANDLLFYEGKLIEEIKNKKVDRAAKHGSGCVFSSAFAVNIALNKNINEAFAEAKEYTLDFLLSNETLLGQHHKSLIIG